LKQHQDTEEQAWTCKSIQGSKSL